MSFDWLNVPGLSDESNVSIEQAGQMPPPSVSFDFGNGSAMSLGTDQSDKRVNTPSVPNVNNTSAEVVNTQWSNHPQSQVNNAVNHGTIDQYNGNQNEVVSHHQSRADHPHNADERRTVQYRETPDELRVPLSLSRSQLTRDEVRTYLRWYNYITVRTHSKLVRLIDVFKFLANFNISEDLKERITVIFRTCKNALNIGQFFAVLRLVSKALIENKIPNRKMILEKAPIPKPRPILSSGAGQEVYEEVDEEPDDHSGQKVDFDSFASLLLTGKSVRKRIRRRITNTADKNKRVRFSEHLTFQEAPSSDALDQKHEGVVEENEESDKLDLSLPMDQLLKRMAKRKEHNTALVSSMPNEQQETEEEREVLEEMKDSLSHFKQIQTVDFASMAPGSVPSIVLDNGSNSKNNDDTSQVPAQPLEPLKPTSTGSANYLFRQHFNPPQEPLSDNQGPPLPLKPTATGSANYLMRNHVPSLQQEPSGAPAPANSASPIGGLQPLKPTATGSGNYLMKQHYNQQFSGSPNVNATGDVHGVSSPRYTGQLSPDPHLQAPQPHVSLQQQLSPQITPQTQNMQQQQQHGVFSVSNPAGSYFQALLSHSPSPNPSSTNLPMMNPGSPYQDMMPEHTPTSQSRAAYNSGYQYSSPIPNQQRPMFTGSNQPQLRPQQLQLPQQKSEQYVPQQRYTNGFSAPRPYTMPTSAGAQSGDILSDLQTLQQQVDALQNSYSRH